jgi:hypothetical protein
MAHPFWRLVSSFILSPQCSSEPHTGCIVGVVTMMLPLLGMCSGFDPALCALRCCTDVRIDCHSERYRVMRAYAAAMVFVYPVGIPMWYFLLLLKHKSIIYARNMGRIISMGATQHDWEVAKVCWTVTWTVFVPIGAMRDVSSLCWWFG